MISIVVVKRSVSDWQDKRVHVSPEVCRAAPRFSHNCVDGRNIQIQAPSN